MAKVLFFQFGNFLAASDNQRKSIEESYHDQYKSVDFVKSLTADHSVTVASVGQSFEAKLVQPGLRAIEFPKKDFFSNGVARKLLSEVQPDMVVVRLPHYGMIRAAIDAQIQAFPCFADVFTPLSASDLFSRKSLRRGLLNRRMRKLFESKFVTAIGNHSLSSSESIEQCLGVDPNRITPWEWSKIQVRDHARFHPGRKPLELLYVGKLSVEKGVSDLLDALRIVEEREPGAVRLTLAGSGNSDDDFHRLAIRSQMPEVIFLGQIPKKKVRSIMERSDAIIVPSRPSYAEGLPNSVVEGLAYRLPVIVSEHASTKDRLSHAKDALISKANSIEDLAGNILLLVSNPSLYRKLSVEAGSTYHTLFFGRSWYQIVQDFVDDPMNSSGWVYQSSLAKLRRE